MAKKRFRDIKKEKASKPQSNISTPHYATVGLKTKAFLTDAFMLMMPIMYTVVYLVMDGLKDFQAHMLLGWIYILVPLIFVQTAFMHISGQTPGYRAYNITLIDMQTKKKPSLGIVFFRNVSVILSVLTFVGWTLMFFRKDHKTLHDLLSATALVLTDDKIS